MTPEELHNIYAAERDFWWYQGMRAITASLLDSSFAGRIEGRDGVGLEAGCGTGFNALEFESRYGLRMFGVDLAPLGIQYCRERKFLRSLAASVMQLPFADNTFDVVSSIDVLPVLPDGGDETALREFRRVLKPGGWLNLRVAAFRVLRSRHSEWVAERRRYRANQVRGMLSAGGFRVVRWTYANSLLSPIALAKFRIWEPLTGAPPRSGVGTMPSAWLNRLLLRTLLLEAAMIRRGFRFPFGQSFLALAQKPASSHNT